MPVEYISTKILSIKKYVHLWGFFLWCFFIFFSIIFQGPRILRQRKFRVCRRRYVHRQFAALAKKHNVQKTATSHVSGEDTETWNTLYLNNEIIKNKNKYLKVNYASRTFYLFVMEVGLSTCSCCHRSQSSWNRVDSQGTCVIHTAWPPSNTHNLRGKRPLIKNNH